MNKRIIISILTVLILVLYSCNPKITQNTILNFENKIDPDFKYFGNGHLTKKGYTFKVAQKGGRKAGEVARASDATAWSGMYSYLKKPIYLSDGKRFAIDVWMDHIGSFTFKLEESTDGGQTTSLSMKNTKINQWETLFFDFSEDIMGGPSYPKIAIFCDLFSPPTGKDVRSYFSNLRQISTGKEKQIIGDKTKAIVVVVLGSSTAAGTGPSESRNAWVNRFRRKLQAQNGHHQVINLAVGGYTTYQLLPTGTKVADGRPQPSQKHNTTHALSFNPDAIIINLPSNDANLGFSVQEQMDNYTLICQPFYDRRIPVWVTTPQGRNMEEEKRNVQRIVKDSTYLRFGHKTLDFWKNLAHWSGTVTPAYNSGDGVHLNDEGHRLLFEEVWSKDILGVVRNKSKGIIGRDSAYSTPLYRSGYVLTWQDEFDGVELNSKYWSHELGDGCPELCGWGNRERVWYRAENSQVKDGKLIITARPDKENEGHWSASRIVTYEKVDFRFGRIDIRAKLPETKGLWPALWLLGNNRLQEGWPSCGEIDIMEEVGHIAHRVQGTIHYKGKEGVLNSKGDKYELLYDNFSDDFHVFSIDWDEKGIRFFVDDKLYADRKYAALNVDEKDNPFLKSFYMIINLAVGGNLPGNPDWSSVFPQTLEVDYVRHFKANKKFYCPKLEEKPKQLPTKENLWIYLMAGQSNMEGQGVVGPQDTISNPRLLTMNKEGEWILAKEPLHFSNTAHMGLSCGYSFGESMLASVPDSVTIALIPCALGGSSVDHWLTDSLYRNLRLWSNMESKIDASSKDGIIKGMIWHQGETDAKKNRLPHYQSKLNELFDRIKSKSNNPDMFFVTGELGRFDSKRPLWIALNNILKEQSKASDKIATILTFDLKDNGDEVHFDTEALRMMGKRYAVEMLKMEGYLKGGAAEILIKASSIKK